MQTRQLGNSDLHITPIGFGRVGHRRLGWEFAWGSQDDNDSIAAIHDALDAGVNWIDTAAVYGLGHSEEVVARALEGVAPTGPTSSPSAAWSGTSSGRFGNSLKADSIRARVRGQPAPRFQRDAIDLYQIHWPDPDEDIEEGWATLAALKEEGKVR